MPVVTPFGELTLNDDKALGKWLQAHAIRHGMYVREHVGTHGGTLDGPVDGDWMLRHATRHVALATIISDPLGSADTKVLALPRKWQTEQELSDWHALHNRLHSHIDEVRGIASHTAKRMWFPPSSHPGPIP